MSSISRATVTEYYILHIVHKNNYTDLANINDFLKYIITLDIINCIMNEK